MRRPDDTPLGQPRPRALRPWPLVAVILALLVGVALWLFLWGGSEPPEQVAIECAGASECGTAVAAATHYEMPPPPITGRAAVVMEASCGDVIYALNADLALPPASLTKVMSAIVAADEEDDLDRVVNVRVNSAFLVASTASTVMGLQPGQRASVRDLLNGMLLASGNDAAIALAEAVAGSESAFVERMNARAQELELENTHFSNPHGLDQGGLYTSARDIAILGRELLGYPELAAIVRSTNYQPTWDGPQVWNGNALLDEYPWSLGIKIGYTEAAGQTIVAAAEANGRVLIVSVLAASNRYSDAAGLFDWAFEFTQPAC